MNERDEEERKYQAMVEEEGGMVELIEDNKEAIITLDMMKKGLQTAIERAKGTRGEFDKTSQRNPSNMEAVVRPSRIAVVKLSKLSLREFEGDSRKWREFWSGFEATVHKQDLLDIQKLNYLMSCLKSAALRAVDGCEEASENSRIVTDILIKKFGDPAIVKRTLYKKLKEVKRSDRDIESTVEKNRAYNGQLEAMGELNHTHIEVNVEEKLPWWALNSIYELKDKGRTWNTRKLRGYLDGLVRRKENINIICGAARTGEKEGLPKSSMLRTSQRLPGAEHNKTSTLAVVSKNRFGVSEPRNVQRKQYAFCNGDHWNDECGRYLSFEKRFARIKELRACMNCISGQTTQNCKKIKKRCRFCNQTHISVSTQLTQFKRQSGSRINDDAMCRARAKTCESGVRTTSAAITHGKKGKAGQRLNSREPGEL